MHIILSIFVPRRFINTFYTIEEDKLVISRYYAQHGSSSFKKRIDTIDLNDLVQLGFQHHPYGKTIEQTSHGRYERYVSQELQFELKDHTVIPWNVRPYTKKQIEVLLVFLSDHYNIEVSDELKKSIHL